MSYPYLTTTQQSVWIPEVVANMTIGALGAYLNLGKTVAKDAELTQFQFGNVINVPKRGALVANQKGQGSFVTIQQPSATDVPVTLDQNWEVTIGEEDYTRALQYNGSTLPGYVEDSVIALGEKIESALAGLYASFTHVFAAQNDPLTVADITRLRADLVGRKVPQLAPKFLYLHPNAVAELLQDKPFSDPKFSEGSRPLTEGALGRVNGFDIFEGQLVQSSGSPATYYNLAYLRNAMVLATRPQPMPDPGLGVQAATVLDDNGIALRLLRSYNPLQLATQITTDVLFGTAVLDDRLATVFHTQAQ